MSLPNKASNLPTNIAAGAAPVAPAAVQASTTGGGAGTGWPPGWIPPWQQPQPTITPNPINPFVPQQPQQPYVPDVISTSGTDFKFPPLNNALDRLLYALGVSVFPFPTPPEKCSSCEQDKEIVITYGRTINRKICRVCATKVLDKVLGAKVDAELESILYEKTDTK